MHSMRRRLGFSAAFTLIELLVVIAIIAILAVVVVLTLNPAQLLAQSRDANRLSDLATMNSAVNLYNVDQAGGSTYSLGIASTTYISVFDPAAVSTAGTNCSTMGVPAAATGWTYHCAASSTYRSVASTTGWIPIAFSMLSAGAPFGSLPVDPANNTSSLFYYAFRTGGNSQYELTVPLESTKYLKQNLLLTNPDPAKVAAGTGPGLIALEEGLTGYWPMDEGSGNTAQDLSGNGDTGSLCSSGLCPGVTPPTWAAGEIGSALSFNGTNNSVTGNATGLPTGASPFTVLAWVYPTAIPGSGIETIFVEGTDADFAHVAELQLSGGNTQFRAFVGSGGGAFCNIPAVPLNQWSLVGYSYSGGTSALRFHVNNTICISASVTANTTAASGFTIGSAPVRPTQAFIGPMDEVRVYNRALSAAEIGALYNAGK